MSDLFDIPETLSPYLQWERDNRIKAEEASGKWFAAQTDYTVTEHCLKFGYDSITSAHDTREEAVANLVKLNKIKPFGAAELER